MLSVNRMLFYTVSQLLHTHLLQILNCREQMFFILKKNVYYTTKSLACCLTVATQLPLKITVHN
jgi:hypothetical protein